MHEIGACELEDIDVVVQLANRETVWHLGIVRDVEVLCGKTKYPTDFLVLGKEASKTCPIIFGRRFLNTCGAVIDCKKENFFTKFNGESYEFNFQSLLRLLMKMTCLMKFFELNSLLLLRLLLIMPCSNSWKITKVMFLARKEKRLTIFFSVNHH